MNSRPSAWESLARAAAGVRRSFIPSAWTRRRSALGGRPRAFRAGSDSPKEVEAVDPGRVAVAPVDVEGVVADDAGRVDPHVGVHVLFEDHALPGGLADALRARAAPPQIPRGKGALVPVRPADRHPL